MRIVFIFPSPFRIRKQRSEVPGHPSHIQMASSSLASMPVVQQGEEENKVEENNVEALIGAKTASQYRKELAEDKTVRGELTPDQRALRQRKLDAYDAGTKASGKRVCLGKCTRQLNSIQADTTAIRADTANILANTASIKKDTADIKKCLETAKDDISN